MTLLPSPIPHPLDYCPWDVPGWIYEALDWVIGVEWPEGDERAVWDLADQWYGVADVLGIPRNDAVTAAGEVRSGYGGVGLVAKTFDLAWHKVAEGEDAPLHAVLAFTGELGKVVESCGCDIEGAKLEAWIELGILVVELLSLAVLTVATAGVASPAMGAATAASRVAVQQIFKRLVTQLARKAVKEGLKEAGERAAKEAAKSGARRMARRALAGGLIEAGQEAGTNLATQAYQNTTGRRDGIDLTDAGMSGLGGFAGGAVAPLAGLGGHAHGRFTQLGEHLGREVAGETLADTAAGLATGQGVSLEDLARAAASGVSGSATGQADAAMHHRLDGKLTGLTQPMDLALAATVDVDEAAPDVPVQRTADLAGPALTGREELPAAVEARPEEQAAVQERSPVHLEGQPADSPRTSRHVTGDLDVHSPRVEAVASPMLSSVIVEPPVFVDSPLAGESKPNPLHTPTAADPGTPSQSPLAHGNATTPAATPVAPQSHSSAQVPSHPVSAGAMAPQVGPSSHPNARPAAEPITAPSVPGHDARPVPKPRFPLLESLAPAPGPPDHDRSPAFPGPSDPLSPPRAEERAAQLAADREAFDRYRYRSYLESQRVLYEQNRRAQEAEWCRVRADLFGRTAAEHGERARQLQLTGHELLAQQWHRSANDASIASYELRERAQQILVGSVVPKEVRIEARSDFDRINDDVADLAHGAVETSDRSALTGDGYPPPIDRTRRYGVRGGLRPPLALHQTDLERQMPRNPDGSVVRTADPRYGGWFPLANDGGPQADATRGINCLDCTLSLYETWVHGRPRVSAPRTFDGYLQGDVRSPVDGELDGPERVEEVTGGWFQNLCAGPAPTSGLAARQRVEGGYRDLHWQLLGGGHGSYAFLITSFEGGGSHAWVALNQNGTVLYLDPQNGSVWDRPLYTHSGVSHSHNTVAVDALVLGPDGEPMPLADRPPGIYNVLPELREPPEPPRPPDPPTFDDEGDPPDFNHAYLLGEDTTFRRATDPPAPGSMPSPDPAEAERKAHLAAHADRIATGLFVRDAVTASGSIEEVFAAGVTPVELAQHIDAPTLRRLVPGLDESAADDVARLFGDPRVQQLLDQAWEASPRGEPLLAEALVHQLSQRPDLARMILATPELANSLLARPVTLHQLARDQEAIDVLGHVLKDIAEGGPQALILDRDPVPDPTPLTSEQRTISAALRSRRQRPAQVGFDQSRKNDEAYRNAYLEKLYADSVEAQLQLNALAVQVAADCGRAGWRTEPKKRGRVMDKLIEYRNDVSQLKDLAGAKVEFDHLDGVYRALAQLAADPAVRILDIKDRFQSPQSSGYRDVLINLDMPNGHVAELRLQLRSLERVARWEHALYEVRRDLETLSESGGRPLTKVEKAIRDGLLQRAQDAYRTALDEGLDGTLRRWQE